VQQFKDDHGKIGKAKQLKPNHCLNCSHECPLNIFYWYSNDVKTVRHHWTNDRLLLWSLYKRNLSNIAGVVALCWQARIQFIAYPWRQSQDMMSAVLFSVINLESVKNRNQWYNGSTMKRTKRSAAGKTAGREKMTTWIRMSQRQEERVCMWNWHLQQPTPPTWKCQNLQWDLRFTNHVVEWISSPPIGFAYLHLHWAKKQEVASQEQTAVYPHTTQYHSPGHQIALSKMKTHGVSLWVQTFLSWKWWRRSKNAGSINNSTAWEQTVMPLLKGETNPSNWENYCKLHSIYFLDMHLEELSKQEKVVKHYRITFRMFGNYLVLSCHTWLQVVD
jgi:hypothetical protein